jgi:DNA modification methylase
MDITEALELIHQYSPPGGLVMDGYAGTLKVAMAAIRLNRRSLSVEIDRNCYDLAVVRTKRYYKWVKAQGLLRDLSGMMYIHV